LSPVSPAHKGIFADESLDISGFAPKPDDEEGAVPVELVRAVAEASRFSSRGTRIRRPPRIHRTGRTMQFNARAKPETVEALYAIADQQGWLVGETLEHAVAALQRKLTGRRT
jgi:hypothetical protein